jgi:hypothetical protein
VYAGELPLPLLAERSLDWDAVPAAALRRLAQGTHLEGLAELYLKSFEAAFATVYSVIEDLPIAETALSFLPPVRAREQEYVHITMRRRIALALAILDQYADDDRAHYQGQLFVDTHLDWLAAAMRYGELDDDFWLRDRHLTTVYPLPNRVRCADELPNLAPLLLHADLFMESSKTKQAKSAHEDIARILAAKAKPAICHVRHVASVLKQATQRHTMVGELLLLIVHTVLAGAFPHIPARPSLRLRLRLHLAFVGDPVGQRSGALTIEAFWVWADAHKEALLKLIQVRPGGCSIVYPWCIQEHFIYWCEQEGPVDDLFSTRLKWLDFKRSVRHTNAQIRRALDAQLSASADFWVPLQWDEPHIAKLIHEGHKLSLDTCQHNYKGRAGFIIQKKMVAVAAFLCVVHAARAIDEHFPELRRVLAALYGHRNGGDSMEDLARRVYKQGQVGQQQLPAPFNVTASGAEALLHGHACASKYSHKAYDAELVRGPAFDFVAMARDEGHPKLAERMQKFRNAFVALALYVAEESFLPIIRERVRTLVPAMELAASYSSARALRPDASARERAVMQLRWLQVMGLTRAQCERVRAWTYEYAPPPPQPRPPLLREQGGNQPGEKIVTDFRYAWYQTGGGGRSAREPCCDKSCISSTRAWKGRSSHPPPFLNWRTEVPPIRFWIGI